MSFSRRQVLAGAAGFTLALPTLPSLLPRAARATDPDGPRRFVAFASGNGGYGILQLSSAAWYAGTDKYNADVIAMMGDRAPWVGGR